jgi:hypothetical protein
LNAASRSLAKINKNNESFTEEIKWQINEENNIKYLTAAAVLPKDYSLKGAGLLRGMGVNGLNLNIDFSEGSSRLAFRTEVYRQRVALENVSNQQVKSFGQFFFSYFCGANLKFNFTSLEEAMTHSVASPLLKLNDNFVNQILQEGQKLSSTTDKRDNMALLEHIFHFYGNSKQALKFFKSAWLAINCIQANENLDQLSSMSVMVNNEVFKVEFMIPKLLEELPSQDMAKSSGLYDPVSRDYKFLVTDDEASKLAQRVNHKKHPNHGLVLTKKLLELVDDYWCDECSSFGKDWVYYCPECLYVVHPEHLIK